MYKGPHGILTALLRSTIRRGHFQSSVKGVSVMKEENPETQREVRKAEPVKTGDLDEAIERIFERYGGDLQAFFRDAQKEATHKRRDTADAKLETCLQ